MKDLIKYCEANNISYVKQVGFVLGNHTDAIELYAKDNPRLYTLLTRAVKEWNE